MISRLHVISDRFLSHRRCNFLFSQKKNKKMAAKYPDSDNDLDISFEVSDSEAACVADWSLCGDEKSSTVAARPSAVNADSAPDTRPTSVEASIAAPRRIQRALTDDERLVQSALERAGYWIDPCK